MHFNNAGNFAKDVWREGYRGTALLRAMQTKEARGGVGAEGLTELGEGRGGNGGEPLQSRRVLRWTGGWDSWRLDLFLLTCCGQSLNGESRDVPADESLKPLRGRPPGSRPPVWGQFPTFLESCSRAAPDRTTPRPSSPGPART